MRESCLHCAMKHVTQAMILHEESIAVNQDGTRPYELHKWIAAGHLAEASSELEKEYPDLAKIIRHSRIAYMEDETCVPDFMSWVEMLDEMIKVEAQ